MIGHDLRTLVGSGVVAAVAGVTAVWALVLMLVPGTIRDELAAAALLTDVVLIGGLVIPAQWMLDRRTRVVDTLSVTPLAPVEYFTASQVSIGLLTVPAAVVLHLAAGAGVAASVVGGFAGLVAGVALTAIGLAIAVRVEGFTTFLLWTPVPTVPVMALAALWIAGIEHAGLGVSPATGAIVMIGSPDAAAVGGVLALLAVWAVGGTYCGVRAVERGFRTA
jgi:hypothetical protein